MRAKLLITNNYIKLTPSLSAVSDAVHYCKWGVMHWPSLTPAGGTENFALVCSSVRCNARWGGRVFYNFRCDSLVCLRPFDMVHHFEKQERGFPCLRFHVGYASVRANWSAPNWLCAVSKLYRHYRNRSLILARKSSSCDGLSESICLSLARGTRSQMSCVLQ